MMTCHSILLIGLTQDTSVDNHQDVLCPVFNFLCVNDNIGNDKLCRKLASSQMEELQISLYRSAIIVVFTRYLDSSNKFLTAIC